MLSLTGGLAAVELGLREVDLALAAAPLAAVLELPGRVGECDRAAEFLRTLVESARGLGAALAGLARGVLAGWLVVHPSGELFLAVLQSTAGT